MAIKRRDLLEASKLLTKHKLTKPGDMDSTALMLAVSYLNEKRDGDTDLEFPAWLDEDFKDEDLEPGEGDAEGDEDPSVPTPEA